MKVEAFYKPSEISEGLTFSEYSDIIVSVRREPNQATTNGRRLALRFL